MGEFLYSLFKGIGLIAVIKDSKTTDAAKYDKAMMALENEKKAKRSGGEVTPEKQKYPGAREFGGALLAVFGLEVLLEVMGLLIDIANTYVANTYSDDWKLTMLKIGLGVITAILCLGNAVILFSLKKFERRFFLSGIFLIPEAIFTMASVFLMKSMPIVSAITGVVAFASSLAVLVFFVTALIHSVGEADRPVGNSLGVFLKAYFIARGLILVAEFFSVPFERLLLLFPETTAQTLSLIFLIIVVILVFFQLIIYVWKLILLWECVVFLIND